MTSKDYAAAAEWAERDMKLPKDSSTALRGQAAADHGVEVLDRALGGRPSLDEDAAKGQHSPRRQVRLPGALSDQVDQLAKASGRTSSAVMREAIERYVGEHFKTADSDRVAARP